MSTPPDPDNLPAPGQCPAWHGGDTGRERIPCTCPAGHDPITDPEDGETWEHANPAAGLMWNGEPPPAAVRCTGTNPCRSCRDRLAEREDGSPVSPHEAARARRGAVYANGLLIGSSQDTPELIQHLGGQFTIGGSTNLMILPAEGATYTATTARDTYTRAVTVVDVIDGDTFRCEVDLGFYVRVRMSCRLAGLNAPEKNEPGGKEVRTWLATVLTTRHGSDEVPPSVVVHSVKADKFAGRFDAVVMVDGENVNEAMIRLGFAVPWDGTGPRPLVPWPPVPQS